MVFRLFLNLMGRYLADTPLKEAYSKACDLFPRRSVHPKYSVQRFEAMSIHHFPAEAPRPTNRTSCIQNRDSGL